MGILRYSHAWRAMLIAWGMAWFGPATDLSAGTPDPKWKMESTVRSDEPFGRSALTLSWGGVREKWRGVERKLDDERVQLALCDGDRNCSPSSISREPAKAVRASVKSTALSISRSGR